MTSERFRRSLSPGNFMSALMEMKDFAQRLPSRVNRIATGLVLAALIVGAAP